MNTPIHVSLTLRSYIPTKHSFDLFQSWTLDDYSHTSPLIDDRSVFIPAQLLKSNLGIPYTPHTILISTFSAEGYDLPPTFMMFDYDGIHLEVPNNCTQVFVDVFLQ